MDQSLAAEFITLATRHLENEGQRHLLIQSCCPTLAKRLNFSGAASDFAAHLWSVLSTYGEITPGKPATVAFLDELSKTVGVDQRDKIKTLADAILYNHMKAKPDTLPPQSEDLREQWIIDTLYNVGTGLAALNERVIRTCQASEDIDDLKKTMNNVGEQVEKTNQGMRFNRHFFLTIVTLEMLVIITLLTVVIVNGAA